MSGVDAVRGATAPTNRAATPSAASAAPGVRTPTDELRTGAIPTPPARPAAFADEAAYERHLQQLVAFLKDVDERQAAVQRAVEAQAGPLRPPLEAAQRALAAETARLKPDAAALAGLGRAVAAADQALQRARTPQAAEAQRLLDAAEADVRAMAPLRTQIVMMGHQATSATLPDKPGEPDLMARATAQLALMTATGQLHDLEARAAASRAKAGRLAAERRPDGAPEVAAALAALAAAKARHAAAQTAYDAALAPAKAAVAAAKAELDAAMAPAVAAWAPTRARLAEGARAAREDFAGMREVKTKKWLVLSEGHEALWARYERQLPRP